MTPIASCCNYTQRGAKAGFLVFALGQEVKAKLLKCTLSDGLSGITDECYPRFEPRALWTTVMEKCSFEERVTSVIIISRNRTNISPFHMYTVRFPVPSCNVARHLHGSESNGELAMHERPLFTSLSLQSLMQGTATFRDGAKTELN